MRIDIVHPQLSPEARSRMDTAGDPPEFPSAVVRLRLLGPVAAWRKGREIDLGPPLQRAALCLLAAEPGQVVSKEQLIGGLWGGGAPDTAGQSIYTYVGGLRRALEPGRGRRGPYALLVSAAGGYLLRRDEVHVDAEEFERRLIQARRHREKGDGPGALRAFDKALELWAGPALCGIPGPFAETERARLEGSRVTAGEERADLLLELGQHQKAVEDLKHLVGKDPLRERAWELLMLALYRCGRQAEALNVFVEIRDLLAERLGVDPGEGLRTCHELILRNDPRLDPPASGEIRLPGPEAAHSREGTPHTPRQLPRDLGVFVGRTAELRRLRSLLAPGNGDPSQAVVAITGTAGAGKSALAIHAAHAVRDAFRDGQVYVNLLGATPGVEQLKPVDMLGRLLRGMGVRPEAVPTEPEEAASMLRDRLQGLRVLIVLDDASGPHQVRPLLRMPPGTAVLITSRESFAIADDCVSLRLATLPSAEAVGMLSALVGERRVAADPSAADELTSLCGRLPLALRLAAARLMDRPHAALGDLVERLRDRRRILHELETGDVTVRASLELSYDLLSRSPRPVDQAAARALCHLGVLHVPSIAPDVLAALLDASSAEAERCVDRLVRAHLAETDEHGRVLLHDLVRLFAMELAERHLDEGTRRDALERAVGLYGETARLAMKLLDHQRVHPPYSFRVREPIALSEASDALAWLEAERANVLAAVAQATASPHESVARAGAHLAFSLHWPLTYLGQPDDILSSSRHALNAGERMGDRDVLALAHGYVAIGLDHLWRTEEAIPHLRTELELQRGRGDRFSEMRALGNLAVVYLLMERYEEALAYARAQLDITREIASEVGERHALMSVVGALLGQGKMTAAMRTGREAHAMARKAGDLMHECDALLLMGQVRLKEDDPWSAVILFGKALALVRESRHRTTLPKCLGHLGEAQRRLGRLDEARASFGEMLALARDSGDRRRLADAEKGLAALGSESPSGEPPTGQESRGRGESAGAEGEEQVDAVGHR
ncbi:BTAD domain-containing putative transcriptional regulator [Microbispora sp. NPDC049125]|uniref:AfsR/SARP family transcriptional regulator n=1 Tax=Microbispora sp. NPDC049125 TaxID=3154929 RepID=UPI003466DE66